MTLEISKDDSRRMAFSLCKLLSRRRLRLRWRFRSNDGHVFSAQTIGLAWKVHQALADRFEYRRHGSFGPVKARVAPLGVSCQQPMPFLTSSFGKALEVPHER
jgi:hypothetical protein